MVFGVYENMGRSHFHTAIRGIGKEEGVPEILIGME